MNKLRSYYTVNKDQSNLSRSVEILHDFVIVALASLILSGFIVNNHRADTSQIIFMLLNASLLSTHWFTYSIFRQRYEKKSMYFRIQTILSVFALGAMAVGIDLMVFRKNGDLANQEFLQDVARNIWIIGFILSRLITAYSFFMASISNKEIKSVWNLTFYKGLSRIIIVLLAIIHLTLNLTLSNHSDLFIYVFLPIYVFIEFLGNILFVTKDVVGKAPQISFEYTKERYSKLNLMYISSIFVAGTVQFAFYFRGPDDMYMLSRVFMTYLIGFLMWWAYSDRVYRFELKQDPKILNLFGLVNLLLSPALAMFGGVLINSNNRDNYEFLITCGSWAMMVILTMYMVVTIVFAEGKGNNLINKKEKQSFIFQTIPALLFVFALALTTLFITPSIWCLYGVVAISLVSIIIFARITIETKIKVSSL